MDTTVELAQLGILKDAAQIANQMYQQEFDPGVQPTAWRPGRFKAPPREREAFIFGDVFRPDPIQSEKGGLTLTIDPHLIQHLSVQQQNRLREIGRTALRKAIIKNKETFVGIILGEARAGRNYFDRFDPRA